MTTSLRSVALAAGCMLLASTAGAQTSSTPSTAAQPPAATTSDATRPATSTFSGDTGIWYVPTAEVMRNGKWSAGGYRRGTNWIQGYSNVADFAGSFAFSVRDRAEIFGSFIVDTRIDRDIRPIFVTANTTSGGVI